MLIKKFPCLNFAWQVSEKEDLPAFLLLLFFCVCVCEELCYFLTINSQKGFQQHFHDAWLLAWKFDILKYLILILFGLQVTLGGVLTTVIGK